MLYTSNRVADQDLSEPDAAKSYGDITIGDDVWIGANVFVTEGSQIGENAVVGANSVVTHDIPPHAIATGTPATVTQFKSYVDDDTVQRLQAEFPDVTG
jgi:acetyltransferase-like isoleucine patch superfamily enzyme